MIKLLNMKHNYITINSCLILILGLLSIDLYNPALPEMVRTLGISNSEAQSLVVYYLAGFAISQLFYGPLSDKKGRIPVILISISLAAVGNLLTSTSTSLHELIIYRLLTGIGAGGCPVISRAILSDTFKDKTALSKALSVFSMASQISPAFAPILGGYITAYLPWKYNFIALSLLLVLGGLFIKLTLPETAPLQANNVTKTSGFKILLSDSGFMIYSVVSAILFSITIGYFIASPFIFQLQFGLTPDQNGLLFIFYSVGIVIGSYLTRALLSRYSPERILMISLGALLFVSVIFPSVYFLSPRASVTYILTYAFFIALGCGLSSPLLLGISLHGRANLAGTGSALQGTIKMAGSAITLYFFSVYKTTSTDGLMVAIFIMSLMCFAMIGFAQLKAHKKPAVLN